MIEIDPTLVIPDAELTFTASRSGGPGGQNVNKVNTRVLLFFDVEGSPSLTREQKDRIRERLATRTSKEGVLRVISQVHRSQAANRVEAVERFVLLLRGALAPVRERRKTRVPKAAAARRIEEKKRRAAIKRERGRPDWDR